MSVLIVSSGLQFYGGAFQVIEKITKYLQNKNIGVEIIAPYFSDDLNKYVKPALVTRGNEFFGKKYRNHFREHLLHLFKNRKKISGYKNIILINFPSTFSLLFNSNNSVWICNEPSYIECGYYKKKLKRPVFFLILLIEKLLVRKRLRNIIVADEFNRKRFNNIYKRNPQIVNYGIDSNFFYFKTRPNNINAPYKFLQVGIFSDEKNQIFSLKVFLKILKYHPNSIFTFAGPNNTEYFKKFRALIPKNYLNKNIKIIGNVSHLNIRSLYWSHTLLIHPVNSQGGALAALEAISSGIPIIVSDQFQMANEIISSDLGFVSKESFMVSSIKNILSNYPNDKVLKTRSRFVMKNYIWDKFSEKVYDNLIL